MEWTVILYLQVTHFPNLKNSCILTKDKKKPATRSSYNINMITETNRCMFTFSIRDASVFVFNIIN